MSDVSKYHKLIRLYVEHDLTKGKDIVLTATQAHYLKNVLRRSEGDSIRLFNGRNGEWLASLDALGKKSGTAIPEEQIRAQNQSIAKRALYFAPIKKNRMDFLIEKAVELGVTDLHPVLSGRTEVRKINEERLNAQIIEAAEQCERLTLPTLHPLTDLIKIIGSKVPLYACLERQEGRKLKDIGSTENAAFLIGPEGGFSEEEINMLHAAESVTAITLGENILRAETAALKCLSL